jgi:tripartite-type tricarboxylate transporter receptor subunit TctC
MKLKNAVAIFGVSALSLTMLFPAASSFAADKYASKPINMIMTWPAGGASDITLRPLATAAGKNLGQPMPVEYHPGGTCSVGLGVLKMKKPDGYAVGMTSASAMVSQHMRKVHYDLLKDFTLVMQYADNYAGIVVQSGAQWKTLADFVNHAKANPGKIRYSTTGPGGTQHLSIAHLGLQAKLNWIHIPFEGGPAALTALLGGHVEAYSTSMQSKPHIQSGKLRLLVTYGPKRNESFPDVPTLQELGYEDAYFNSQFILAPKGMPADILANLDQAFKKATTDPDFIKATTVVDHVITYRGPAELAQYLQKQDNIVSKLIVDLNLREGK